MVARTSNMILTLGLWGWHVLWKGNGKNASKMCKVRVGYVPCCWKEWSCWRKYAQSTLDACTLVGSGAAGVLFLSVTLYSFWFSCRNSLGTARLLVNASTRLEPFCIGSGICRFASVHSTVPWCVSSSPLNLLFFVGFVCFLINDHNHWWGLHA